MMGALARLKPTALDGQQFAALHFRSTPGQ